MDNSIEVTMNVFMKHKYENSILFQRHTDRMIPHCKTCRCDSQVSPSATVQPFCQESSHSSPDGHHQMELSTNEDTPTQELLETIVISDDDDEMDLEPTSQPDLRMSPDLTSQEEFDPEWLYWGVEGV